MDSTNSKDIIRYLIIEYEGALDGEQSKQPPAENDLVISQSKDKWQILQGGVEIVKYLHVAVSKYNYELALFALVPEKKVVTHLKKINEACQKIGLSPLPSIKALAIGDSDCFQGVKPENSVIVKSRSPWVAGYDGKFQDKESARAALSKLLEISEKDRQNHFIFDRTTASVQKARGEGWTAYDLSMRSLRATLALALEAVSATSAQKTEKTEQKRSENQLKTDSQPISSNPSEMIKQDTKDIPENSSQNQKKEAIEEKKDVQKTNPIPKNETDKSQNELKEALQKKLEQDKKHESSSQPKKETKTIEKPPPDNIKVYDGPLISKTKFRCDENKIGLGNSVSKRWYYDETNQRWFGKCSMCGVCLGEYDMVRRLYYIEDIEEYKEYVCNRLYKMFGIQVPEMCLSPQFLPEEVQTNVLYKGFDVGKIRLHVMSKEVIDFNDLGKAFIENYKAEVKENKKRPYFVEGGRVRLKGWGTALAVGFMMQECDPIGKTGGNMGYVCPEEPEKRPKSVTIFKLDTGKSLPFEIHPEDAEKRKNWQYPPDHWTTFRIVFEELNEPDQKEFAKKIVELTEFPDSKIKEAFEDLILVDKRFVNFRDGLLMRKQKLLDLFKPESKELILKLAKSPPDPDNYEPKVKDDDAKPKQKPVYPDMMRGHWDQMRPMDMMRLQPDVMGIGGMRNQWNNMPRK